MLKTIKLFFFPHQQNQHRAFILRHYSLLTLTITFILLQINLALFHSSTPQVLGFARNIYQQDFFTLVNQERARNQLPPLKENSLLDQAALLKAEDMFQQNYWAHVAPDGTTPWDFFTRVGYQYSYAGENLAKDFNTSAGVVAAWMASASHRANILNPNFKEMGIAVLNGTLLGKETTLVVQLFGTPANSLEGPASANNNRPSPSPAPPTIIPLSLTPTPLPSPTLIPTPTSPPLTPINLLVHNQQKPPLPPGVEAQNYQNWRSWRTRLAVAVRPQNWGLSEKITIVFLLSLIFLLLTDSLILWRRNLPRRNSHSLLHGMMLFVMLIITIFNSLGAIL